MQDWATLNDRERDAHTEVQITSKFLKQSEAFDTI